MNLILKCEYHFEILTVNLFMVFRWSNSKTPLFRCRWWVDLWRELGTKPTVERTNDTFHCCFYKCICLYAAFICSLSGKICIFIIYIYIIGYLHSMICCWFDWCYKKRYFLNTNIWCWGSKLRELLGAQSNPFTRQIARVQGIPND